MDEQHTKKGFDWRIAFVIVVFAGLGFFFGMIIGTTWAAQLCIDLGLKVAEGVGIEIPIDRDLLKNILLSKFGQVGDYIP